MKADLDHVTADEWARAHQMFKWLLHGWGDDIAWFWLLIWRDTKRRQAA